MFVGRERELKSLEMVYEKPDFGMTVIYGRRRVGKSTLIREFVKGKKAIFYTATKIGAQRNLELFSKQVLDVLDPAYGDTIFPTIEAVFEEMCRYYTLELGIEGKFGSFITKTGTWWGVEQMTGGNGKRYQQSADIDVVGLSTIDKTAVVGECKFKNEKFDKVMYETLVRRSQLLSGKYHVTRFLIFSLGGFTKWFYQGGIKDTELFTLDDLYMDTSR